MSLVRRLVLFAGVILAAGGASQIQAQFNSGSTGADGAFAPLSSQTVQLPASGVFNFTTVNIPSSVTITFARNAKNTPVTILASGDVTILGTIDISGQNGSSTVANGPGLYTLGGQGGPGGFDGGGGGSNAAPFFNGLPGNGPGGGGGAASNGVDTPASGGGGGYRTVGLDGSGPFDLKGKGGLTYGAATAQTLIGGSGGGGSSGYPGSRGTGGGGGAGAILIASSGKIIFQSANNTGLIFFHGGSGGGYGSSGAIRLIASTISGTPNLYGNENYFGGNGGGGYVRIEAFQFENHSTTSTYSYGLPSSPVMPNPPQLQITKVAGQNTPANPSGSFNGPSDVVLPTTQTNPITVEISATNVPVGTAVQLNVISETTAPKAVQSSALDSTGKATANITLPQGRTLITATVVVQLSSGTTSAVTRPPLFINGEKIDRIEVTASVDGQSDVTYVSTSGRRIKKAE